MKEVLLVEDKDSLREMLRNALEENSYKVEEARDGIEAVSKIKQRKYLLILSDLRIPHITGLEILRVAKEVDPDNTVIFMTAYGSIEVAVEAMKNGAYDFLPKPVDINHLLLLMGRIQRAQQLRYENIVLKEEFARRLGFPRIIGEDRAFQEVALAIQKAAPTETTVLITGESGTGKELFARAIHQLSPRKEATFVALNCAAIPESLLENELFGHEKGAFTGAQSRKLGKFELANGGSLFLDEIGEMTLPLQAKLLRVLQEREFERVGGTTPIHVDVRIITATNKDLEQQVHDRAFREDLFFRISVFPIHIPPLRQRRKDIPILAQAFLEQFSREMKRGKMTFSSEAMDQLLQYSWPGNIRELQNCVERSVIVSDTSVITAKDVVLGPRASATLADYLNLEGSLNEVRVRAADEAEKCAIRRVVKECNGDLEEAARKLGVSLRSLSTKMKTL